MIDHVLFRKLLGNGKAQPRRFPSRTIRSIEEKLADSIFDRKGRTKAVVVNGVDKTCRSSMFYPILLLNVNPSHISLPRDFDIS